MAVDMALAQLVASIVASAIAYALSKSGKQIWRTILGFILGWIVGWIAGFFLGMAFFKGDTVGVQMRAMGTTFWMALIFSGVGVFLGRRKLKSGGASHNVITQSMPQIVAVAGTTKLTTPNSPSVQINSSAEKPHTMPTPSKPSTLASTALALEVANEDYFFEIVANELETGNTDKGLWTRLYAEHDGDEKKTKIAYIKQRVEKLIAAERARQAEHEAEKAIVASKQTESARRERILKERLACKRVAIGVDKFETFDDLASHAERTGFSTAKYWLGLAYLTGYVVEQDLTEARIWFEDSANEAHEPAIKTVAQLNASGWELRQEILGDLLRSSVKSADDFVVQAIVSKYPDLINEGDSNGYTALHFAATGSSSKILKYLIDNGGHIHKKNLYGKTPIETANDQMRPVFPA